MTNREVRNLYADITNRRNFKRAYREVMQEKAAAAKRWEAEQIERERQWNSRMDSVMDGLRTLGEDIEMREVEQREIERIEAVLAQSGAAQREATPDAVDMAPLAQTPRRRMMAFGQTGLLHLGILAGRPTGG